jgi:DNA-binding PadR family transcriptional regulator
MPDPGERPLALTEWPVLCIACEKPTYGFSIAGLFSHGGSLGRVWQISKPTIYRAIQRLDRLGLVQLAGQQHTHSGPDRSLVKATRAGRAAARVWLRTPVPHGRDVRSELLIKLALLDRAGGDPADLLSRQRAAFGPLAAALADRVDATTGVEHTLALWRHETMSATMQFLAQAAWQAELAPSPGPGGRPWSRPLPLPLPREGS